MGHDRDLGVEDRLDHRNPLRSALHLDTVGARANQRGRVPNGFGRRDVEAHPRHVADHQRRRFGPADRGHVVGDVVDRDVEGVVVAEHHHGQRVADQDHVDVGLGGHPAGRSIVGRHHHQRISPVASLRGPDLGNGSL